MNSELPTVDFHEYSVWPDVDETSLSDKDRKAFLTRKEAVKRACDGATYQSIQDVTGIKKQNIRYFLERCRKVHPDGSFWGFRALIPRLRIKEADPNTDIESAGGGSDFARLLKKHPDIEELIIDLFIFKAKTGEIAERAMLKKFIHQEMLAALKAKGVTEEEYPWRVIVKENGKPKIVNGQVVTKKNKSLALRSLERFLDGLYDTHFRKIVKNYAGDQAARNMGRGKMGMEKPATRFLERVELDGWQFHALFEVSHRMGRYPPKCGPIQRPWFLALIDQITNAILAYILVFAPEPTQFDLLRLFKRFLAGWSLPALTAPNLKYKEGAGMPSDLVTGCPYWLIDELRVDNAFIHTARETTRVITHLMGGTLTIGRYKCPKDRPNIERFNKKMAQAGHRLPNTTGNRPGDPRRKDPEKAVGAYGIDAFVAEQVAAQVVGNYNVTKQKYGLGNHSPLDVVRQCLNTDSIRCLLDPQRLLELNLTDTRVVRGDKQEGRRPYIQYENIRYSSENLKKTPSMQGQTLSLSIDVDNLQQITAFNEDGSFFDYLIPNARKWQHPHTIEERKLWFRYDGGEEDPDSLHNFVTQLSKKPVSEPQSVERSTKKGTTRRFQPLSEWVDDDGLTRYEE